MKQIFKKLADIKKNLMLMVSFLVIISGGWKWLDLRIISKVKNERQNRENLENVVNSMKGALLADLKKVDGRFYIKLNNKKIPVFIKETATGNKYIFVEDGKSTIYIAGYDSGKEQYFYINYDGTKIEIYNY